MGAQNSSGGPNLVRETMPKQNHDSADDCVFYVPWAAELVQDLLLPWVSLVTPIGVSQVCVVRFAFSPTLKGPQQLPKLKSTFYACPYHEICRVESVDLSHSNRSF